MIAHETYSGDGCYSDVISLKTGVIDWRPLINMQINRRYTVCVDVDQCGQVCGQCCVEFKFFIIYCNIETRATNEAL